MPLARMAMYERGIDVLLAPTWDNSDEWVPPFVTSPTSNQQPATSNRRTSTNLTAGGGSRGV